MILTNYNVAKQIEPYLKKMIKVCIHIHKIAKDFFISSEELVQLTKEIPFEICEIIEKVKKMVWKRIIKILKNQIEIALNNIEELER